MDCPNQAQDTPLRQVCFEGMIMRSFLTRPQLDLRVFMCQKRIAKVRIRYGYRFGTGKTLEKRELFRNEWEQSWTERNLNYI